MSLQTKIQLFETLNNLEFSGFEPKTVLYFEPLIKLFTKYSEI